MELNRNSKFNRFYVQFHDNLPNNFCDYFWGCFTLILKTFFTSVIVLFLIFSIIFSISIFWFKTEKNSILEFSQFCGAFIWCFTILFFSIYKFINYLDNKPRKFKAKQDSVIKTWYKDFKNKNCTLITWKD